MKRACSLRRRDQFRLKPVGGFEPPIHRLRSDCSSAELHRQVIYFSSRLVPVAMTWSIQASALSRMLTSICLASFAALTAARALRSFSSASQGIRLRFACSNLWMRSSNFWMASSFAYPATGRRNWTMPLSTRSGYMAWMVSTAHWARQSPR